MDPLTTKALIEVGKAVAKSIFKFWVKDSKLGDDISSSLIDLVGSKTTDALAQRKGERQFEEIADKISEDILPFFERENANLDEGERRAVAYAIAETLNTSKISAELLIQQNLQPTQLVEHVLAANPVATRDFNEASTSLYHRIIKETCTYIVDISSQLPSFTEHTFAEVLKREDLISAKVGQILEELRKMREQLDPRNEADRFEIEYREAVARNLDILQLIGADVSLPNRRHRLSVAYITLSVARETLTASSKARIRPSATIANDDSTRDIVSVDSALASSQRLLIRGFAGSGKTTLLQWIAVRAATKSFDGPLTNWNGCIPFFIRLRHYSQSRLPKPEAFPDFVAPAIAGTMPKNWVHNVLRSGRALVLVDGIDEVSASQREEIYMWLIDLVETYKEVRYVVTSRPHAIEEGWMNHASFGDALLQDMGLADIYSFIDHWHEAVKQELLIDEEKNESDLLAEHLKEQVKQARAIRNLATNPLLCALLCALNRERRRQLPINRIELYNACCSMLLERREKESRIDLSDYPKLSYTQKSRLLENLAYWMIKENLSEAETSAVDESFTKQLAYMPNTPQDVTGKGVRRLLVERAGMIREPIEGKIDFPHRTFQEFFAAQAALNAQEINQLIANAHDYQWREVIILAAGLASKAMCEELVDRLLKRGDQEENYRHQLHLIAVSCLETAIELKPEIREEVEKRLSQLVPPKTMTDAKDLASAGELAVKYLDKKRIRKKRKMLSTQTTIACIRTLANIGGDAALNILEDYAKDDRVGVINELLRAWDSFDRAEFAKRILSITLETKSFIKAERITSINGIQYLPHIIELDLSGCTQLSDVTPISGLPNLEKLDLSSCTRLNNIDLMNLPSLTTLILSDCDQVSSINLKDLPMLAKLNLTHCAKLISINLVNLSSLTVLDLTLRDRLSNINLANLQSLNNLFLYGCNRLKSINMINLPSLTTLSLSKYDQVNTIYLENLSSLKELSLSNCSKLSSINLKSLPALTRLNLSYCTQLKDVALYDLPKLSSLNLFNCKQLRYVQHLRHLPKLAWLNISGCTHLNDIEELENQRTIRLVKDY